MAELPPEFLEELAEVMGRIYSSIDDDPYLNAWEMPEIFSWLQEKGNLKEEDMYRVFNCGIGMVLIVNRDDVDSIQKDISDYGYKNFLIGEVVEKNTDYPVKYL